MSEETSIAEITLDVAQLNLDRKRLTAEKAALQAQLTDLNSRCSVRIPNQQYHTLQRNRAALVGRLHDKEAEIAACREQIIVVNAKLDVSKAERQQFKPSEVKILVAMRERWNGISLDDSVSRERRKAAWEFVTELNTILKPRFDQ